MRPEAGREELPTPGPPCLPGRCPTVPAGTGAMTPLGGLYQGQRAQRRCPGPPPGLLLTENRWLTD